MKNAIFLDKDGTLIENIPYNVNPALIHLYDHAKEGLQLLSQQYILIIISNQAGIAKGLFNEEELKPVYQRIQHLLQDFNIEIIGFYYCPHNDDNSCMCRKPQPGLLLQAADDLSINLQKSWMIGDILDDVEAGNRAGCKSILVNNNNETEWKVSDMRKPFAIVTNLEDAAKLILTTDNRHI